MKRLIGFVLLVALCAGATDVPKLVVGPEMFQMGANNNYSLDATTTKLAILFMAEEDACITGLAFRQNTVTGAQPVYKISLQSTSSGAPTGTILGATNSAYATFTPAAGNNGKTIWNTLGEQACVTRGTVYASVIEYSSGTNDGTHYMSVAYGGSLGTLAARAASYAGASWSAASKNYVAVFGYKSSTKVYGSPTQDYAACGTLNGTTEGATVFSIPATIATSYKVLGVRVFNQPTISAGTTLTVTLYATPTGTPSILQQTTFPSDMYQGAIRFVDVYFDESTLSTLSGGTTYAIGFSTPEGQTGIYPYCTGTATTGDKAAFALGAWFSLGTRTLSTQPPSEDDTAAFTVTDTSLPQVALILSDWTVPAASAGGGTGRITSF